MSTIPSLAAITLASSLNAGLPEDQKNVEWLISQKVAMTSDEVKGGVDAYLGANLSFAGLKGLKNQIVFATNETQTMTDAVSLPPYIDDVGEDTFEWYSSLSKHDRDKVNNFYNGLIQLPSTKPNREIRIKSIMSNYVRFIKATSSHPGELFGFAKSSLEFAIQSIRKGGFPEELATRLSQYLEMADKADKDFKVAKAELDEINARITELIKKRDKLRAENERGRAENERGRAENERGRAENERGRAEIERGRAEIERLDGIIKALQKTKELLSQKAV